MKKDDDDGVKAHLISLESISLDQPSAVEIPAKWFKIALEKMREERDREERKVVSITAAPKKQEHLCAICGINNSLDNLSMCKRCGDMICSTCVIDELKSNRRCACGGEIEE